MYRDGGAGPLTVAQLVRLERSPERLAAAAAGVNAKPFASVAEVSAAIRQNYVMQFERRKADRAAVVALLSSPDNALLAASLSNQLARQRPVRPAQPFSVPVPVR